MWILLAMIAIMPFEVNPYLHLSDNFLGVFADFTMIKLLGLIALGWSFIEVMTGRFELGLFQSSQARAFLLFLGTVIFAGLASGAGFTSLTRLISIVCFLFLVLAAVRTDRDLKLSMKAAVLIMILVFPYAYRQMIRFGGRFGVGLYESNYLALTLVLLVALSFVLAHQETSTWKRKFWWAGMGVLIVEIILTGSRGGFLGLLVVLALISFRQARRPIAALGAMACLLLIVFIFPTTLGYRLRASASNEEVLDAGTAASNETRLEYLKAGLRMIQANPLTGVGLGNFKSSSVAYGAESSGLAHNTYLELAAELGLPALFTFFWLLYGTFISLRRSGRLAAAAERRDFAELATAVQIGLTGWMVSAFFLSAQFEKFFWLVVFLSICLGRIIEGIQKEADPKPVSVQPREVSLAWPIR